MKRSFRSGVRQLLGVFEDESLQTFVERRGAHLRQRGERAYRSLEWVMQGLGIAPPKGTCSPPSDPSRVPRPEPRKFDLGQGREAEAATEHIPWAYGHDRVTAMPVDPDRLYVYWEVSDDAIARARRGLGAAGDDAWLSLRVYDVTGRIFDGTNAHAYFDHRVERHDRQWFLPVGKPGSTVCVEVGMKSSEGYFVRIARSSRVDFPRAAPVPAGDVEWMSVRSATGEIESSRTAPSPPLPPPAARWPGGGAAADAPSPPAESAGAGRNGTAHAPVGGRRSVGEQAREWLEIAPGTWHEIRRSHEWVGEVQHTSWEAGPFPHPVEPPPYEVVEQRSRDGHVVEAADGTRVVEWPWEVIIRGIGAHLERRVLARWEIVRTAPAEAVEEAASEPVVVPLGASEQARLGASERRLVAGSEVRLAGASEEFLLGASERRFRGASERVHAGASERRWPGGSERVAPVAGQWLLGGASEWRPAGASEHRLSGASELVRSARASWQAFAEEGARLTTGVDTTAVDRPGGASERLLGVSEGGSGEGRSRTADRSGSFEADPPLPPRW